MDDIVKTNFVKKTIRMIKYTILPENIEFLLIKAEVYLKSRSDVMFACLFGSLAKNKPMPLSDVDMAIYLLEDTDIAKIKIDILGKLMTLL